METYAIRPVEDQEGKPGETAAPSREEVLEQLERLVQSTHFRNSKRYPTLLRFVVEETLAGRMDSLKERTLGIEVFDRPLDYDTNADPIVRFTAGEIRKRIALYYQTSGHEHELRFDLPTGSYVPHFHRVQTLSETPHSPGWPIATGGAIIVEHALHDMDLPPEAGVPGRHAGHHRLRSSVVLVCLVTIVLASLLVGVLWHRHVQDDVLTPLWNPFLSAKEPSLIVLGVHSFDSNGNDLSPASSRLPKGQQSMLSSMTRSDMVPISDVVSYSALIALLARHKHVFTTQSAAETTLDQLRGAPVLLIGGFDNMWTMRLTSTLRFRFAVESQTIHSIIDIDHPEVKWKFDNAQDALDSSSDYAIVSGFFNTEIEQYVLVVAGIGKSGTEAAAEFLTTNTYLQNGGAGLLKTYRRNFEVVLSTEIIEGRRGPPRVLAETSW